MVGVVRGGYVRGLLHPMHDYSILAFSRKIIILNRDIDRIRCCKFNLQQLTRYMSRPKLKIWRETMRRCNWRKSVMRWFWVQLFQKMTKNIRKRVKSVLRDASFQNMYGYAWWKSKLRELEAKCADVTDTPSSGGSGGIEFFLPSNCQLECQF